VPLWLKHCCISLCALGVGWAAQAEVSTAQLNAAGGRMVLAQQLAVLEDVAGTLAFSDVQKADADGRFRTHTAEHFNVGYSSSVWWLKFTVTRSADATIDPLLEIAFPTIDAIDVYIPTAQGVDHQRGGDLLPWTARAIQHPNHVFALALPEGSTTVYIRLASKSVLSAPMTLWEARAFEASISTKQMIAGVFYGLLLTVLAYNIALWISLRDRVYLYYIGHAIAGAVYLFSFDGYAYQYLWPQSVYLANHAMVVAMALYVTFSMLFAREFMALDTAAPRTSRLIAVFSALGLLFGLIATGNGLLELQVSIRVVAGLAALSSLVTLVASVRETWRGSRPARFFLLASAALLVFILFGSARSVALAPANFFTIYCLHVGLALEVLLLSFGLADRIHAMRTEHAEAQAAKLSTQQALLEATQRSERELEQRVAERTTALHEATARLQVEAGAREQLLIQLKQNEEKMRYMAQHDALTGLPNRYSMQERLAVSLEMARRNQQKLAVMMLDLDGFKQINDTHGHAAGDWVLSTVAQRLSATVRGADTVARLGGDEFVVLATALESAEDAMVVARKLSEAVSAPVRAAHGDWQVGCSVGLAIYPLDGETAELLIAIADREMYRVKEARHAADRTGRVGEGLRA